MTRGTALGGGLVVAGIVGYTTGVVAAYPGRAFSLTALMVGIALLVIQRKREVAA